MSEPRSGTSSGTAELGEEALMVVDDSGDRCWVGRGVPLIELERAAEDDPVGPREHVAGTAGEGVLHLGLRLQDGELSARRAQLLVAEQLAAAEAGAVEDQSFGKRRQAGRGYELAHL